MGKSSSRFSFILKNGNNELDETISLLFSNISQSQYKGDLAKLIRDNNWCSQQLYSGEVVGVLLLVSLLIRQFGTYPISFLYCKNT